MAIKTKRGVHFSAIHDVPFLFLSGAEKVSEAFQASFIRQSLFIPCHEKSS